MKSKKKLNILRILFIISLIICLLIINDSYAKYQEFVNTSYASTIKRWKLIVNDKVLREQEKLSDVVVPVLENNLYMSDDVLVPAREGYLNMDINFSEVDVPFTVEVFMEQKEETAEYKPLPDFKVYGYYFEDTDTFYYNLPEEYQQVEYIESTGTQYIDTNIIADSDRAEITMKVATNHLDKIMSVGGSENTETDDIEKSYLTFPHINNNIISFNVGKNENIYSQEIVASEFYKVTQKYTDSDTEDDSSGGMFTLNINNEQKYADAFEGTIKNNRNVWLFANNSESGDNSFSSIRIKEFKYIKNDYTAIELVPCYRIADGVIGMYDMITGNFFINSGTGEFIKGEDIKKVTIDPTSDAYKDLSNDQKVANVKAYIRWIDGDGTLESPVDILDNVKDTELGIGEVNDEVEYTATAIFEQYIEE